MKAAYVGFGVLGKQIQRFVNEFEKPEKSVFFDDFLAADNQENSFPFAAYPNPEFQDFSFYICLGYKHLLQKNKIVSELLLMKRSLPTFVHPTVYLSSSSVIAAACVLYPNSTIDMDVHIEQGTLLNNAVVVSHNSVIQNCCYLSPGIVVSGNVVIGENTFIGSGTCISNDVMIGPNSVIGVGSVLTKSIPENTQGIGNPFRILPHNLNL
jgi:sugar O-acyltransferase (sialic acid O-acetyltransferase NeuD family)